MSGKKVKDEVVLAALISSPSVKEASKACGLGETQIFARLRDPEFSKLYKQARRDLLSGCMAGLQASLGEAVDTMAAIMRNEDVSAQVRLNAAESIMRNSMKLTEQIDILERVDALEKMLLSKEETE